MGNADKCHKKPKEAGWGRVVDMDTTETSDFLQTEIYQKGSLRVVSSYVDFPESAPRWMVSVSIDGQPPNDKIMERIKKAFGMQDAEEVGGTLRHRMLRLFVEEEETEDGHDHNQ